MAPYFDDHLDDDEDDQNPGGIQISGASPTTGSTGAIQGSNQAPAKDLKTGSGFQNLDKYLNTNQSQQFGQQVLGKVDDQVKDAGQKMNEASDQFKNTVQTSNAIPTQDQYTQALANPGQANAGDFQKWQSQSYEGPKSLAENQNAWNKYWSGTNQANTSAKQLGSESGRFSLLDSYFGRPQYNFGEKSLDNLLVQQSGLGKETQTLQNQAAQLNSQGKTGADALQGFASVRAGEVDKNRNAVNQAYGNAQTEAQGAVNQAWEQANAGRSAETEAMKQALASKSVNQEQLAKLGLGGGQDIYNLDLNSYLTQGNALSKEQTATDSQRARLNALSQLSGTDQKFLGEKAAATDAYSFDKNKFTTASQAAGAGYKQDLGSVMKSIAGSAPLKGDYLRSLNAESNPSEVMSNLSQELTAWTNQKSQNNPYADKRIAALTNSMNALRGVMTQYGIDSNTGTGRKL